MTKRPFIGKGVRATQPLELIHSYVSGPMSVRVRGVYEFKEFRAEVENQLDKTIKALRSDRRGEYLDQEFEDYMVENGIVSQLTALGTPQQNGGYALQTATYILNVVPSKSVPKTPLELWNGRKAILRYFRIWGYPVHVLKSRSGKLEPRSQSTRVVDDVIIPQTSESHMIPSQDTLPLRRSVRVVRQPDHYLGIGEAQGVVSNDSMDYPHLDMQWKILTKSNGLKP
ncbi:hypothetical protein ACOSP7_021081 [Xanthoceras sorbifolium]